MASPPARFGWPVKALLTAGLYSYHAFFRPSSHSAEAPKEGARRRRRTFLFFVDQIDIIGITLSPKRIERTTGSNVAVLSSSFGFSSPPSFAAVSLIVTGFLSSLLMVIFLGNKATEKSSTGGVSYRWYRLIDQRSTHSFSFFWLSGAQPVHPRTPLYADRWTDRNGF